MKKFVNCVQPSDLEHLDVRHSGRCPFVMKLVIPVTPINADICFICTPI